MTHATGYRRPSNREIFDYYADKNQHALSLAYAQLNPPSEGADQYAIMFNEFCTESFRADRDNQSLYRTLRCWRDNNLFVYDSNGHCRPDPLLQLAKLAPLNPFARVAGLDFLNPLRNAGGLYNQKWHLFIAVFAYSIVCGVHRSGEWQWDRSDYTARTGYWDESFRFYPSQILRLWLIENAADPEFTTKYATPLQTTIAGYCAADKPLTKVEKKALKAVIQTAFSALMSGGIITGAR